MPSSEDSSSAAAWISGIWVSTNSLLYWNSVTESRDVILNRFFDRGAVETDEISIIWTRLNARRIKQIDVISFSWTSYNARSHLSWSCSHWNSSKEKVVSLVEEYFALDDVMSMAMDLHTLGSPNYHHYFVKKLVSMALDCHDWEKEMASMLLFALYVDVIEPDQIAKGFRNLLESIDDLSLDIPDAIDFCAAFLAQAAVDDIPCGIPHKDEKSPGRGSQGVAIMQQAEKSYLLALHHAEVVNYKWGSSTYTTVVGSPHKDCCSVERICREW
ncbi:unnamed protein product [Sphagnum tenellum]